MNRFLGQVKGKIRGVSKGSMFHSCWMWVIPCNFLKTTRIELTDTNQNSDSADCYFGGMYYKKLCVRPGRTLGCKSRVRRDCGAKPTKTPGWPTTSNVANKNTSNRNANNSSPKCHFDISIWTSEGKKTHLPPPSFPLLGHPDFQNVSVTNPPILWNAWGPQDPRAVGMFQVFWLIVYCCHQG